MDSSKFCRLTIRLLPLILLILILMPQNQVSSLPTIPGIMSLPLSYPPPNSIPTSGQQGSASASAPEAESSGVLSRWLNSLMHGFIRRDQRMARLLTGNWSVGSASSSNDDSDHGSHANSYNQQDYHGSTHIRFGR